MIRSRFTLFLLMPLAVLATAPLPPACAATIAHWTFDGEATWLQDSSGNGHSLTDNSTGAAFASDAASFSGGGTGTLFAGSNAAWSASTFTVEAIITPDALTGLRSIAGHFTQGDGRQWLFLTTEGKLSMLMANSSGTELYHTWDASLLQVGHTYYVAAAVDLTAADSADRLTFYLQDLDGGTLTSFDRGTSYTSLLPTTTEFTIGSTGHASSRFDGLIDEVRFSDSVLGVNELLVTPEPARALLMVLGLALLGFRRRRNSASWR